MNDFNLSHIPSSLFLPLSASIHRLEHIWHDFIHDVAAESIAKIPLVGDPNYRGFKAIKNDILSAELDCAYIFFDTFVAFLNY
jgi:hypothetical protein